MVAAFLIAAALTAQDRTAINSLAARLDEIAHSNEVLSDDLTNAASAAEQAGINGSFHCMASLTQYVSEETVAILAARDGLRAAAAMQADKDYESVRAIGSRNLLWVRGKNGSTRDIANKLIGGCSDEPAAVDYAQRLIAHTEEVARVIGGPPS